MGKALIVIDLKPGLNDPAYISGKISEMRSLDRRLKVFLHGPGVMWLAEPFWQSIFDPEVIYYANVYDVKNYNIDFQPEVIFSSPRTLNQLMDTADIILHCNQGVTV